MFGGGFRAQKLRVSLKLAINRFKHLEKKKSKFGVPLSGTNDISTCHPPNFLFSAENAIKARKEIADYLSQGKDERARIRVSVCHLSISDLIDDVRLCVKVEHIIREDYLVEAMEILEMYCDLLLARFGLIETMK